MAETTPKTSSPRKRTTKRGPTKAAALKALGLSQDDLDTLKAVAAAREAAAVQKEEAPAPEPAPSNPAQEAVLNPEPDPAQPQVFYARNLGSVTRFRLSRQQDKTKRATELKPRGQRGDMLRLEPQDLNDPELITQVEYGLIEIITEAQARDIIRKQAHNVQQAIHPAMAALRNELGEEYAQDAVHVDVEYNSQGITVAQLTPQGGGAGALPDLGRRGVDWNAIRQGQAAPVMQPVQNPSPGRIVSDGFAKPDVAADMVARQKNLEGPAAGGVQRVVVEAPQPAENSRPTVMGR
jgi:hypothetical protein